MGQNRKTNHFLAKVMDNKDLCWINLRDRWTRAQGPAPRGAPHLEDAFKNNQKQDKSEMKKREKEEKKGKEIRKRERKINWFIRQAVDK